MNLVARNRWLAAERSDAPAIANRDIAKALSPATACRSPENFPKNHYQFISPTRTKDS
jgi:hypothetical protein